MNRPQKIIIHHSLTEDNQVLKNFNAIKRYHIEHNGWRDIGYHWVLEMVSNRYFWIPGRKESDNGAHTKEQGMNFKSIGICAVGNFDETVPSDEIYRHLAEKCVEIMKRYSVITVEDIEPHRKYATYKSCPGTNFDMDRLIREVKTLGNKPETLAPWQREMAEKAIDRLAEMGLLNNPEEWKEKLGGTPPPDWLIWEMMKRLAERGN